MPQPNTLELVDGVIVSIGIVCNNDRQEIVFPMSNTDAGLDAANRCNDAVMTVVGTIVPAIQNIMSADAYVSFVQAEGLRPGCIPARLDYIPATFPGNRAAGPAPSNVAALLAFYADPDDLNLGQRTRVAKTFIPGIAAGDLVGDKVVGAVLGLMITMANFMLGGMGTQLGGGNWYRICGTSGRVPPMDPLKCVRLRDAFARDYVATQRRRLLPH